MMAGPNYPVQWEDFSAIIIATDEEIQRLKIREGSTTKKSTPSNTNNTKESHPNNSKFKLTDEECKEHVEGNLCFKCHKKGHASKDCCGERTVYAKFKKKKAQVTNVETQEEPSTSKGKAKAQIKEVAQEEEEDCNDSRNFLLFFPILLVPNSSSFIVT